MTRLEPVQPICRVAWLDLADPIFQIRGQCGVIILCTHVLSRFCQPIPNLKSREGLVTTTGPDPGPLAIPAIPSMTKFGCLTPRIGGDGEGDQDDPAAPDVLVFRAKGGNEFVHSFVSSAMCKLGGEANEVVFPCREISATSGQQVGTANVHNLEYLFGCPLDEAMEKLRDKRHDLQLVAVGDAATSNVKCIFELFNYVIWKGKQVGVAVTCVFTMCFLHQLARLLSLYLSHQALTASMYSITRLHQHSSSRDSTKQAMKLLLQQRFRYQRGVAVNATKSSSRRILLSLLSNSWDGEEDHAQMPERQALFQEILDFFNGDLLNQHEWFHYCDGCHKSKAHALQHVTRLKYRLYRHSAAFPYPQNRDGVFISTF